MQSLTALLFTNGINDIFDEVLDVWRDLEGAVGEWTGM